MSRLYTLDPLDTYFVRDGRGFDAGADTDATSLPAPTPFTLNGVVRAALLDSTECGRWATWRKECAGCDRFAGCPIRPVVGTRLGAAGGTEGTLQLRGPWFVVGDDVLVPAPLDLIAESEELERALDAGGGAMLQTALLHPDVGATRTASMPPGMVQLAPSRPMSSFSAVPGWLGSAVFHEWVAGGAPTLVRGRSWWTASDLLVGEARTGLAMDDASGRARDGYLYFAQHRRLRPGVRFGVEVHGAEPAWATLDRVVAVPLGGEMRAARLLASELQVPWSGQRADGGAWPLGSATRIKWLLAQTGWFAGGWHPQIPYGWRLVAARVERTERTGGWNALTGDPRPLLSFVPAGAVYYLERDPAVAGPDEGARRPAMRSDTPTALPEPVAFGAMGFGFTLPAAW